MTNILIIFYSRDGSTEHMAKAISDGTREITQEVRIRRVRELVFAQFQGRHVASVARKLKETH